MKDNVNHDFFIGIIIIVCVVLLLGIFGFGGMTGLGLGRMMSEPGMTGQYGVVDMIFNWIMWILIAILIIAGIYWLIKTADRK